MRSARCRRAGWPLLASAAAALAVLAPAVRAAPGESGPAASSGRGIRLRLAVEGAGRRRSRSPAAVALDLDAVLHTEGGPAGLDPDAIAVLAESPQEPGGARRVPHRLDRLFGSGRATLHFVVPDERFTRFSVHLGAAGPRGYEARRPGGLVGDGDYFREELGRRQVAASHFDQFVDFDGDGDLDLFRGGVEPYVHCRENTGGGRLVARGRLASGGEVLALPASRANRSWMTVAFFDLDGDGDQDFLPSFNDGPDSGRIVLYRNVTRNVEGGRARGARLAFERVGPLRTVSGAALAGGEQAGGWFPSIAFVRRWAAGGDEGKARNETADALVGSKNRCWLYRGLGADGGGEPRFADPVALAAGGKEIELVNPRFDPADADGDGDLDLFAGTQPGPVHYFRNEGSREQPAFAAGVAVAFTGKYLIGDAHSGVKAADLDGDGLLDLAAGRFWERADLDRPGEPREFGGFWRNAGTKQEPRWERRREGGPATEEFHACDAVRQNSVRAADWNADGRLDLLAGDTDGSIWFFENRSAEATGGPVFALFRPGRRLEAAGRPLSVAASGGHARLDVCDWQGDGRRDLVVADGGGTVTLFLNRGGGAEPDLDDGRKLEAGGKPIQVGARASVLACDWNNDGRGDLLLADEKGYWFLRNTSAGAEPLLEAPRAVVFGGKPVSYVRPNLGSFVDWDGDGKRDLIGCNFENSVRFYRNVGPGASGAEPEFADPGGVVILLASSPQMISGADAVDWNGDGDIDLLTGQGHGGSGLRFFERDWLEDELAGAHPRVTVVAVEQAAGGSEPPAAGPSRPDFLTVVRRYADVMIDRGRDVHGPQKTGLFLSALDRTTLAPLTVRPAAPGGIRRGDRPGRAWSAMNGANPQLDQNLLRVLHVLTEITGEPRYARAADEELGWFFGHALSPATSLLPWGEHLSWDVMLDLPISGGDEKMHEFARPWVLWERSFAFDPEACRKFALGLWEHQIANHETGGFDRHAPYFEHGPADGKDFPRHAGFYIGTWCHAWKHTADQTFLRAIEVLLARFERKRVGKDGSHAATIGPLDCETAAAMVPEPLASRLRAFAAREDELLLPELRKQVSAPPAAATAASAAGPAAASPPKWANGYSASTLASTAMFCLARHEQTQNPAYRDLVVSIAGAYLGSRPEEDVDAWPLAFAHATSVEVAAYRFTGRPAYLDQAREFARRAVEMFWQDNPLPRASLKTGHYETITGADSLALALLEVHAAEEGLDVKIPSNTIDR